MKLSEYNENNIDAFKRLLMSSNPLSRVLNFFINVFWALFKGIKKLLGRDKIEQAVKVETKVEIPLFKLSDFYNFDYDRKKETIVFVDLLAEGSDSSGALDYAKRKIEKLEKDYQVISLCYKRFSDQFYVVSNGSKIYVDDIELLFVNHNVKKLCINNLVFNTDAECFIDRIVDIRKRYVFMTEYVFHDYLSLCPSYFLITKEGSPCDMKNCTECLYNNPYRTVVINDIETYRDRFRKLFKVTDEFVFFSKFSFDMVTKVYPEIADRSKIIPHEPLLSDSCSKYIKPKDDGVITVGFVGFFHHIKGSDLFIETVDELRSRGLKIKPVVVGYKEEESYKELDYKFTGRYKRDDLGKLLSENKVDLVIYPSLNSETYSYIVQELMLLNVPLVVLRRGAPAERIENKYKLGVIAEEINCKCVADAAVSLLGVIADE